MTEFQKIDAFTRSFQEAGGVLSNERVILGPGDDCAVLTGGGALVMTTDAIVEDVHFRRSWFTWEEVGHKALAVNLSDLAAMGAQPVAFSCALAIPPDIGVEALKGIARGMGSLAAQSGGALSGGNFTRARELSITIAALGSPTFEILRRDAARPGDQLWLIGNTGEAAAELWLLEMGQPLPQGRSALKTPVPLLKAGQEASRLLRCAIDISDGLVQDLKHIATASSVGIEIDPDALPRSPRFELLSQRLAESGKFNEMERLKLLLAGGEDYALALSGPRQRMLEFSRRAGGREIGRVVEGSGVKVLGHDEDGFAGHDHFR